MGDAHWHAERFMEVLIEHSVHKHEPIPEWTLVSAEAGAISRCICEKEIQNRFIIQNKITGEKLIIGCDCALRFNIDDKMLCKTCGAILQNTKKRRLNNDYTCPECRRAERKERDRMNGFTLYYNGPWKGKTFGQVADNLAWVNQLINMTAENKSLRTFQEYAEKKFKIGEHG
jgi:hypothetical protein